ncbi:ribonuclease III [Candidatus Daviesbacteria bacterium]|nr:ribonuclease III [Candidatus Daviesbacteria bacterium]
MVINPNLFKKEVYQIAFTHRSYLNESQGVRQSNERLEFLGDSVLSFIISSLLFEKRRQDAEGDLTNLRSYIVKTPSLAKAAKKLNLGKFLKLSKGEEMTGGRQNPQILANTYEAVLGAIYLDKGIDFAKEFVQATLLVLFENELKEGPPKDSKSLLQELTQNQTKQSPKYKILETSGPDHAKKFKVGVFLQGKIVGQGEGLSKQIAEEAAASEALEFLSENS